MTTAVQRHGQKKQAGLDSLGWAAPVETYRPLLTYEELGAVLSAEPKVLYDALSTVLGLEQMTAAVKGARRASKTLNSPAAPLRNEKALSPRCRGLDDERAARPPWPSSNRPSSTPRSCAASPPARPTTTEVPPPTGIADPCCPVVGGV